MNMTTENTAIKNNSLTSNHEKISHYVNLVKKLLYACEKCDGALVQLATCIDCKRTVMRICVNCNTVIKTGHISCRSVENDKYCKYLGMKN